MLGSSWADADQELGRGWRNPLGQMLARSSAELGWQNLRRCLADPRQMLIRSRPSKITVKRGRGRAKRGRRPQEMITRSQKQFLGRSWADAWRCLGRCWADRGQLLGKAWAGAWQLLHRCWADAWADAVQILGRSWGRSWADLGQKLARACSPWPDPGEVLGRSLREKGTVDNLGRSWADAGQMTCRF